MTPKTEEHESSEDEEDIDEESKLAQAGSESAPLQFSYKGRTATLQSSADIAAWIAERRKKFPTQERIDEKKKAAQEAKDAREAARREKMNEREKMNVKTNDKDKQKEKKKPSDASANPEMDAAMKAQRKADKIRRTLEREQQRFAKAEAEAEAARLKVAALQKQLGPGPSPEQNGDGGENGDDLGTETNVEPTAVPDPMILEATDKPSVPGALTASTKPVPAEAKTEVPADAGDQLNDPMNLSSDGSKHSDWTSSSGSESDSGSDSGSDSDSDRDSDSAPEQASSRRQGPEKVPPPPREGKKQLCRHFARNGQCNRGEQCSFSHDVSERRKAKPEKKEKGRKGLLSAVSNPDPGREHLHILPTGCLWSYEQLNDRTIY